ncbi:MAG: hypothetical protein PVS3B3_36370 [Ktedonobacteraceae bacterium]
MPNKYEREIEEILRNLEQTEPKAGVGQKFNERLRRKPAPRMRARPSSTFSLTLTVSDWLLVTAIGIALVAGGVAFLIGNPTTITGLLAVVGLVCVILVAFSQFVFRPRRPSSIRYGNATITPLRRGPFHMLRTRWNLFMLKIRYRKRSGG